LALFDRRLEQRGMAINAVREFSVGERQEMRASESAIVPVSRQQFQAGYAGEEEEQQREKAGVHI
jgi:hypothetical protein